MTWLKLFIVAFPAIFTIVNPLGAVGPFLAMTARDSQEKRNSAARRACVFATGVLLACAALGGFVFQFFGITVPAFKVAGGFMLFLVGMDMINARSSGARATKEEREEGAMKDDVAIFPLAIPLLVGPGAMVTVFIMVERAKQLIDHAVIYLAILSTMLSCLIILRQSTRIARMLGATGINVMSRMMGLILASIAVQFMVSGLVELLPGLKGAG